MTIRPILAAAAVAFSAATIIAPAAYAEDAIYTGIFSDVALQGIDTVSYFTDGAPVEGSKEFSSQYNGAEFRFASQENLELFLADPEAYAPQYGGYCAWAMADGNFAKGDARRWAIVDGKLYLNYNKKIQQKWNADRPGFITRADDHWPDILNE